MPRVLPTGESVLNGDEIICTAVLPQRAIALYELASKAIHHAACVRKSPEPGVRDNGCLTCDIHDAAEALRLELSKSGHFG